MAERQEARELSPQEMRGEALADYAKWFADRGEPAAEPGSGGMGVEQRQQREVGIDSLAHQLPPHSGARGFRSDRIGKKGLTYRRLALPGPTP